MDFRKCPACQASVLEDDAEDCPFCGASMSGKSKPATKASPPQPAKPASGPATEKRQPASGGSPTSRPSRKPEKKQTSEEDPFEVDTSAIRKALKMAPQPLKTRTFEVVCPMCDTVGYIQPQDAGKDVQCRNSDCPVPIFKSKRPKVEAPPEEPKKNKLPLIVGSVLTVCVLAGVAFMLSGGDEGPETGSGGGYGGGGYGGSNNDDECDSCPIVEECDNCPPERISVAEVQQRSLVKVVEAARDRAKGYNPNEGTRLAAETFALAGQVQEARKELQRLESGGEKTAYLQLQPLAEIAWAQIRQGETDAAAATAKEASGKTQNLPSTVRRSLDSLTSVAATLVATGQLDLANQLMAEQVKSVGGNLGSRGDSSVIWRTALDSGTYDISLEASRPYHVFMPESMRIGVIETAVTHGFHQESLQLIAGAQGVDSQDACRAAWAGRVTETSPSTALTLVENMLGGVHAVGQARAWAAVASHFASQNNSPAAQDALSRALAAAGQMAEPQPETAPSMKQLYDARSEPFNGLSHPALERSASMACADIAIVSLQLKNTAQAAEYTQKAMAYARATTPSPARTQEIYDEADKQRVSVRSELQRLLSVDADEARRAHIRYRQAAENLNKLAQERLAFQIELLRAIAKSGLHAEVFDLAMTQHQISDVQQREPFLDHSLPGLVFVLADLDGNDALTARIREVLGRNLNIDPVDAAIGTVRRQLQQGSIKRAASTLRDIYSAKVALTSRSRTDVEALSLIATVQQTRPISETFEFLTSLTDPSLRQDAFLMFAAQSARAGKAVDFWELLQTPVVRELQPLDRASIYRGFVTELSRAKPSSVSTEAAQLQKTRMERVASVK